MNWYFKYLFYRLVFEFSPTGGVFTMSDFRTVKLLRYVTEMDYFTMSCEIIFCAFVFYYLIEEILEIKKNSFQYFGYIWNVFDIAVLAVSYVNVRLSKVKLRN